jgi:acyl-coenzyme A synthetase/AMP-(fatty) acid ligase
MIPELAITTLACARIAIHSVVLQDFPLRQCSKNQRQNVKWLSPQMVDIAEQNH